MTALAEAVKFSIQIAQLQQELEDLPVQVREVEGHLNILSREYEEKNQARTSLETQKTQLEQAHQSEKDNLTQKEARLNAIKTEKEYRAVSAEITTAKTALKDQTKKIAELSEQISALSTELEPLETKRGQLEQELSEEKGKISGSLGEREEKIKALSTQLNAQLLALPDDIRAKYQRIEQQKQPPAALVMAGTCQACFMSLPPQLYIELQKGGEVRSCPTCHRLLFLED